MLRGGCVSTIEMLGGAQGYDQRRGSYYQGNGQAMPGFKAP